MSSFHCQLTTGLHSTTGGLIFLLGLSANDYLKHQHTIFKFDTAPKTQHDPSLAVQVFSEFYTYLYANFRLFQQAEEVKIAIESDWLTKFHDALSLGPKDYDIKIRVKSLYVSIYNQRLVELYNRAIPNFFQVMKDKLCELVRIHNDRISSTLLQPTTSTADADDDSSSITNSLFSFRDEKDIISLTRFFIGLILTKIWKTHPKWEVLAFYCTCMTTGEGKWYCRGGGATTETKRRVELFKMMEYEYSRADPIVLDVLSLPQFPTHLQNVPLLDVHIDSFSSVCHCRNCSHSRNSPIKVFPTSSSTYWKDPVNWNNFSTVPPIKNAPCSFISLENSSIAANRRSYDEMSALASSHSSALSGCLSNDSIQYTMVESSDCEPLYQRRRICSDEEFDLALKLLEDEN